VVLRPDDYLLQVSYNRGGWNPGQEVAGALMSLPDQRQSWVEIVTSHCRALHQLNQGNTEMAYTHVDAMVLPFTKLCDKDLAPASQSSETKIDCTKKWMDCSPRVTL
jgi:hypothetical protein